MHSSRLAGLALAGCALLTVSGCSTFDGIFGGSDTPKMAGRRVSVLTGEQKLKVDKNLANTTVTLPAPVQNKDWTQIGGNSSHNLGNLALGAELHPAWA